jgi:hypothetical protein
VAKALVVVPDDGGAWTSPLCDVLDSSGDEIGTSPTVTPSTISTTVGATVTSTSEFTVASAAGISAGTWLAITTDGVRQAVQVERVDSTTIYLVDALGITPATGDAVVGIELSLTLSTTHTADRSEGILLVLTDSGDATRYETIKIAVVTHPFVPPMTVQDIRSTIRELYPDDSRINPTMCARLRERMVREIRTECLHLGKYASRQWDRETFYNAAVHWLRWQLADRFDLKPIGRDSAEFSETEEENYRTSLGRAMRSLALYSAEGDGDVSADEGKKRIGLVRRPL